MNREDWEQQNIIENKINWNVVFTWIVVFIINGILIIAGFYFVSLIWEVLKPLWN
jgi:hypothetical protein